MALTPTQRDFIFATLKVQPKPKGVKLRKSSEEKVDADLRDAFKDYIRREASVLEAVNELRGVPANDEVATALELEIAAVQNRVSAAKRDKAGAKTIEDCYKDLESIKGRARGAADKATKNKAFYVQLDATAKLLAALEKHAQKAHVAGEIGTATTELATARREANLSRFKEANEALPKATTACTQGKGFADRFALFVPKRADAGRVVNATKSVFAVASEWQGHYDAMMVANAKADPPTRAYPQAEQELANKVAQLKAQIEAWYVTPVPGQVAALKLKITELEKCPGVQAGQSVIATDVAEIEALQLQVVADVGASKWAQALMAARTQVSSRITSAGKIVERRLAYDTQRAITVAKIDGLKSYSSLTLNMAAMTRLVARADGLASRESMRMEDGIAELKRIDADCVELLKVAADAAAYRLERGVADTKFTELQKLPAAANMGEQLLSIEALLDAAEQKTNALTGMAA